MLQQIAVISDIHGNLPALEAVLADIRQRGITRIICLGDTIGKGPNPDLAVDRVREVCEAVVMGNWEAVTLWPFADMNPHFVATLDWNRGKLGKERLEYLSTRPYCVDILLSGKLVRLYHSSAKGVHHRVHPTKPMEELLAMFENNDNTGYPTNNRQPDVVGYADIHAAYMMHPEGRTLFNVGSLGNPLDIPISSYVIIEGVEGEEQGSFSINFVRVPYDIEAAIKLAENEPGMPALPEYISELRTAKYARKKA